MQLEVYDSFFTMVLFSMLCKVALTSKSVDENLFFALISRACEYCPRYGRSTGLTIQIKATE